MNKLVIGFLIFLLIGCSSERLLKRAEKLIAKAEQKGAKWSVDTVYKEIPVFLPQIVRDTVFRSKVGDTVRIEKDRLKIKYVKLPGDSVYIQGKCEADTVKIEVPVAVGKQIKPKVWLTKFQGIGLFVFFLLLGFMVNDLYHRFRRNNAKQ